MCPTLRMVCVSVAVGCKAFILTLDTTAVASSSVLGCQGKGKPLIIFKAELQEFKNYLKSKSEVYEVYKILKFKHRSFLVA